MFDDERRSWSIDYEGMGRFTEGEVWDEAAEEWLCAEGQDTPPEVFAANNEAEADLVAALAIAQFARSQKVKA